MVRVPPEEAMPLILVATGKVVTFVSISTVPSSATRVMPTSIPDTYWGASEVVGATMLPLHL